MSSLATVRAGLVTRLKAAGLRATTDPRSVNPPCVLVGLAEGAMSTPCVFLGAIPVTVIAAAGAGHSDAAEWLDDTASTAAAVVGAVSWHADTYPIATVPGGVLCYVLSAPAAWEVAP